MKNYWDFQAAPAFRVGERIFLVITRRSWTCWEGGVLGECRAVAIVTMDHDACTIWQLHETVTPGELQEALVSMAGIPQ